MDEPAGHVSNNLVRGDDGLLRPQWAAANDLLRDYYDTEWGMPVRSEQGVFERLSLEVFQSGLSWMTVLKKREAFREAFARFVPDDVAAFDDEDVARLMNDTGIIRNRRKIDATIANARATIDLRAHQGLAEFVWDFRPQETPMPRSIEEVPTESAESRALAKALRSAGFVFVGPTNMYALMSAIGIVDLHLMDSHRRATSGVWPA